MTEEGAALSYEQAVATIASARDYEEPLRRRTEGVTWMVWGFATAAVMFMGVAFASVCSPPGVSAYSEEAYLACQPWVDWVWVPWLLAAMATTKAVWHIAALSLPTVGRSARRVLLAFGASVVIAAAAFGLAYRLAPDAPESAFMFLGLGAPWLVLGAANLHRGTEVGRRVMMFIGATMVLAGLVWMRAAAGFANEGWAEATFVGGTLASGLPIAAGLWQTLRG